MPTPGYCSSAIINTCATLGAESGVFISPIWTPRALGCREDPSRSPDSEDLYRSFIVVFMVQRNFPNVAEYDGDIPGMTGLLEEQAAERVYPLLRSLGDDYAELLYL